MLGAKLIRRFVRVEKRNGDRGTKKSLFNGEFYSIDQIGIGTFEDRVRFVTNDEDDVTRAGIRISLVPFAFESDFRS